MHGSCFIIDHKIISCLVDFPSVANHHDKVVTFRQNHKITVDRLKEGLAASALVAYPSDDINTLYEHYVSSLSDLLDIHAPLKTRHLTKPAPGWITNEFRTVKCLGRQYERTWRRDKTSVNRARVRQQINKCNNLLNKNKGQYYQELCPPHWGVDILFLLFPASHLVSRHFRQQFLSYLYQIWHAGLLG